MSRRKSKGGQGPPEQAGPRFLVGRGLVEASPFQQGFDVGRRAAEVFEQVDKAILKLGNPLSTIGAMQSRMGAAISHLRNYEENLIAARSRIVDADIGREATDLVRGQIQRQASIAILSQANMLPRMALKLIDM